MAPDSVTYILDVILRGEPIEPVVLSEPTECTIGRGADTDVSLDDPHLSRRHVTFVYTEKSELWAHDLGSKNQTEVDGEPIERARLEAGASVSIGQTRIKVRQKRSAARLSSTLALVESQPESRRIEIDARDTRAFVSPENPLAAGQARLEGVYRLAQSLVGAESNEQVFDFLDEALRGRLDFDRYFVALGDPTQGTFEVVRARTADAGPPSEPITMSESILSEIQQCRRAILVEDAAANREDTDSIEALGISSFLCSPLLVNGKFLGAIYVDRLGSKPSFEAEDLQYLQGVAHLTALAIDDLALREHLERENASLKQALQRRNSFVANSLPMLEVLSLVRRFSDSSSPVLILGETGTGKEHVARMVHDGSPRSDGPFVPFNCALSNPALIESELFGHVKGAFTDAAQNRKGRFELADGGSLFLDEIGEMPMEIQAKLLRVLQEKKVWPVGAEEPIPVDVRLVSATHQNLKTMRREKKFRDDLYYRISVLTVSVPKLSQRDDDVIAIAESVLPEEFALTDEAKNALRTYEWPGNVRELQNVLEQACYRATKGEIRLQDLPTEVARQGRREPIEARLSTLRETEAKLIVRTLAAVDGNKRRAAEVLAISRNTLYREDQTLRPLIRQPSPDVKRSPVSQAPSHPVGPRLRRGASVESRP